MVKCIAETVTEYPPINNNYTHPEALINQNLQYTCIYYPGEIDFMVYIIMLLLYTITLMLKTQHSDSSFHVPRVHILDEHYPGLLLHTELMVSLFIRCTMRCEIWAQPAELPR